ncbi:MAG: DUF4234 domain-containing protein [Actinobacteria bacterium]|nr:DUF4234 domain-containing protein [Actinomycetota bacterium]
MSDTPSELPVPAAAAPPAHADPEPDPSALPQAIAVPASADMVQSVTILDRAIKQRRDSDITLVNWWLYFLFLSWITFGIYTIYLFFKRIGRIDRFSERKHAYYIALLDWTERYAQQQGREDSVHHQLADLRSNVQNAYVGALRPIKAGLSFVLTILTLGIYGIYVHYRMNRYWWDAQVLEQDFDDSLSQAWMKVDLMRYPISFEVDQSKRRSFALYFILSIVTFGIWGLVWDHKFHTDPDNLYPPFHTVEDTVLQTVRAH